MNEETNTILGNNRQPESEFIPYFFSSLKN